MADHLEFGGEEFAIADKIGLMPLMRFAKVAKTGLDSADMEALSVIYDLLEQCIAPPDWQRFQNAADRTRADGDELMAIVTEVFERLSERPTSRPSDSSDGPPTTGQSSTAGSSSPVVTRLERQGRPDLARFVVLAQGAQTA